MPVNSPLNLIFATNNHHKLNEVRHLLNGTVSVKSLKELGFEGDIPETGETLNENAAQKAWFVFEKFKQDCFADDTGLEVDALDGRPGVYSARYAGEGCSFQDNIKKLLNEMQGIENRKARFKAVICLIISGKEYFFQGVVEGEILHNTEGEGGFGYDPLFRPLGYETSFALMELFEKNKISHRGLAINNMVEFLSGSKFPPLTFK